MPSSCTGRTARATGPGHAGTGLGTGPSAMRSPTGPSRSLAGRCRSLALPPGHGAEALDGADDPAFREMLRRLIVEAMEVAGPGAVGGGRGRRFKEETCDQQEDRGRGYGSRQRTISSVNVPNRRWESPARRLWPDPTLLREG